MSAAVGTSSISFSGLRTSWGNASYAGGSDPGSSTLSISEFPAPPFTSGSPIDANGAGDSVSIDTHFKGRTFGSGTVALTSVSISGTTTHPGGFNTVEYSASPNSGATSVSYVWSFTLSDPGNMQPTFDPDNTSQTTTVMFMDGESVNLTVTASQSGASDITSTITVS